MVADSLLSATLIFADREVVQRNRVNMDKKVKQKKFHAAIRKIKPVHRDKWTISSYDDEKAPKESE